MPCQYLKWQEIGQLVLLFNVLGSLLILQEKHSLTPVLYLSFCDSNWFLVSLISHKIYSHMNKTGCYW